MYSIHKCGTLNSESISTRLTCCQQIPYFYLKLILEPLLDKGNLIIQISQKKKKKRNLQTDSNLCQQEKTNLPALKYSNNLDIFMAKGSGYIENR